MRPLLLLASLLLLSACASTGEPAAATAPTASAVPPPTPPAATPPRFEPLRPGLLAGGQPTAADLVSLQARGVHTVIDLRGATEDRGYDEEAEAHRLGLAYVALPINGKDGITPANAHALRELLERHGDGVLLHCASGNRVGALLALDAASNGMPREQALSLGRKAGLKSLEPIVLEQLHEPAPAKAATRCADPATAPQTGSEEAC